MRIRQQRVQAWVRWTGLWGMLLLAPLATPVPCAADEPLVLSFVEQVPDPEVFVYDPVVVVGTGPERIEHIAGLRNARLDDPPQSLAYNAEGMSLAFTLKKWLAARGTLEVATKADGRERVIASFRHLVPFGVYSLFLEIPTSQGTIARPLDGDGWSSSFVARMDGSATIAIDGLHGTHDHALALVYHSDGREHGVSRGQLGVTAHEQLVAHM